MKRIFYTLLALVSLNCLITAGDFRKNGTAGFNFLEIPVTARTASLGDASITLADMNSSAVFSNPGALGFTELTHSVTAGYTPWFVDINNYSAAYSFNSSAGVFALSAFVVDFGTMTRTRKVEGQRLYEKTGTFSANSMALGITYAKALTDRFSFGLTAKYVREKIDVFSASNVVMDAGMFYMTGISSIRIAAAVSNFGTNSKFKSASFKMPAAFKLGVSGDLINNDYTKVTLIAEALHPTDADEKVNFGTEIELLQTITLRGGYKFFYDETGLTLGAGLKTGTGYPVTIDFSFSSFGVLGNVMGLTLQAGVL